jgi:hypothetical protein
MSTPKGEAKLDRTLKEGQMDILLGLLVLAALLVIFLVPTFLARRGIGSRWIWFGGGSLGLIGILVFSILWDMDWGAKHSGPIRFDRISVPGDLPLGGADAFCVLLGFGFMLAGLCYKPKKEARTSLFGNHEGSILNAGRSDGKN